MDKFIIDDRLFSVKFKCDVEKCKGACCTLKGAGGAPLLDDEVAVIKRNLHIVKKYLCEKHIEKLNTEGFLEGSRGNYSLASVEESECVFSYYENSIANCSFQKAYHSGESDFIKPISCHLFPVRIHGSRRNIIRYEELYECQDAITKGESENITVFEFAEESITREFGKNIYNEFKKKFLKKY